MTHARSDYNRFQDPALTDPSLLREGATPIAEDEPVMLFRAQDRNFIDVLQYYDTLLATDPSVDSKMRASVQAHIERARSWQEDHTVKSPDMPTR